MGTAALSHSWAGDQEAAGGIVSRCQPVVQPQPGDVLIVRRVVRHERQVVGNTTDAGGRLPNSVSPRWGLPEGGAAVPGLAPWAKLYHPLGAEYGWPINSRALA